MIRKWWQRLPMSKGLQVPDSGGVAWAIVSSPAFRRDLEQLTVQTGHPSDHLLRSALRELRMVAAQPAAWAFHLAAILAHHLLGKLFHPITEIITEPLPTPQQAVPTVLVATHRSHLDYIIFSNLLYRRKICPPFVAAGMNLAFWPAGMIARRLGAYFVRREARSQRIHALVLRHYCAQLGRQGSLQEFFIEGGRSRSGKLLDPKLGLLKQLVEQFSNGELKDVNFIPVSIAYEHVIEDQTLVHEDLGYPKTAENLLSLARAIPLLCRHYGGVTVCFGRCYSLRNLLAGPHQELLSEPRALVQHVGSKLTSALRQQQPLSLTSLICTILLTHPQGQLPLVDLVEHLKAITSLLEDLGKLGVAMPAIGPSVPEFIAQPLTTIPGHLDDIFETSTVGGDSIWCVRQRRFQLAAYYRETVLTTLVPTTAAALQILDQEPQPGGQLLALLHSEYVLPEDVDTEIEQIRQKLIALTKQNKTHQHTISVLLPQLLLAPICIRLLVQKQLIELLGRNIDSNSTSPEEEHFVKQLVTSQPVEPPADTPPLPLVTSNIISALSYWSDTGAITRNGANKNRTIIINGSWVAGLEPLKRWKKLIEYL